MSDGETENLKEILRETDQRKLEAYLQTRIALSDLPSLRTDEDSSIYTIDIDKMASSKSFPSSFSSQTADRSRTSMDNYITSTNFRLPLQRHVQLQGYAKTVRDYYAKSKDTLKIPLVPTTKSNIFDVQDLHVPIILRRKEISPDLGVSRKISPQEVFSNEDEGKHKKFLVGPSGNGKTTEIKMWLYKWCTQGMEEDLSVISPVNKFLIVFYVDCAKLSPTSSLGEAVTNQCFPNHAGVTPADVEEACRDCPNDILVILDNFGQGECRNGLDKDKTLYQLIHGECFQGLNLLVVTRPSMIIDCEDVYGSYDNIQATDGISEVSVQCYIEQVFKRRHEFGKKVLNFLKTRQLVPDMASSPVLLSGLCQIMKWVTDPNDFGPVDRVTDLVGKFIEVFMKHNDSHKPGGRKILKGKVCDPMTPCSPRTEIIGGATSSISTQVPGENASIRGLLSTESRAENRNPEILDEDEVRKSLAVVAFGCFDDSSCRYRMGEADFNVYHNMKDAMILSGCRLGLLKYEGEDEIYPTTAAAAEGKVIQFKIPCIQDHLAAVHLKRLIEGTDEEHTTFTTSLRKIQSANDCLTKRNVLKHACGLSRDASKEIIEHVIQVKESENRISMSDRSRVSTKQAEHLRGLEELLLELNYEANAGATFNSILLPALCDARLISPTELTIRSLRYFFRNLPSQSSPPQNFKITIIDQSGDEGMNLPHFGPNVDVAVRDMPVTVGSDVREGLASSTRQDPPPSNFQMREITLTPKMKRKVSMPRKLAPTFQAPGVAGIHAMEAPSTSGATASPDHGATAPDALASAVDEALVLPLQDTTPNKSEMKWISHREIKYKEDIPFAEGRFGQLFKATWQGKTVAVKRIRNVEGDKRESLTKEVKINKRLNHKNIVPVYAYTEYQIGDSYRVELVMPLIEGCSLENAILKETIPFLKTYEGKMTVAEKICDAIAHVHAKGIAHSDIKPTNVLVRKTDSEPFVCDFGLGHAYIKSGLSIMSTAGKRPGVQRWTSPEVAVGNQQASVAADIWSLSSVLLELFTEKKMWKDCDRDFVLMKRLEKDDVTPQILQNVQDESLRHLFQRCFSKNPDKRPSAQKLGEHFRTALAELRKCGSDIAHDK